MHRALQQRSWSILAGAVALGELEYRARLEDRRSAQRRDGVDQPPPVEPAERGLVHVVEQLDVLAAGARVPAGDAPARDGDETVRVEAEMRLGPAHEGHPVEELRRRVAGPRAEDDPRALVLGEQPEGAVDVRPGRPAPSRTPTWRRANARTRGPPADGVERAAQEGGAGGARVRGSRAGAELPSAPQRGLPPRRLEQLEARSRRRPRATSRTVPRCGGAASGAPG